MNKLAKIRKTKLIEQNGRCYYCKQPMWTGDPRSFSRHHRISAGQTRYLQATAEHILPRSEGGRDVEANIVAACLYCNQHRHFPKVALAAEVYREKVMGRIARGQWHGLRLKIL